jgi:hypothetical protein
MRSLIPFIAFLFCSSFCYAQPKEKGMNTISFEVGKTGLIYNLTYDLQFPEQIGFRLVVGHNFSDYMSTITGGGGLYYLLGKNKRFFEMGADLFFLGIYNTNDDQRGIALVYPNYNFQGPYLSSNLGYRRSGKKTLFRIGCSPGLVDDAFVAGGYISYGIRF